MGFYSLVGGAGDTDNGKFTLAGDTLKANAVFDFETKSSYTIRLRTTNSVGSFEKAFTIRVTDVNEAPSVPTLTSPTNAATGIALNTKLVWQASTDPDGDALTYDVYWGTTNPPTTKVVAAKNVLEYTPSGQSISTKYYWKVVANDGSNQTETAVWNYTTTASALPTVTFHLDGEDTSLQVTDGDKLTSAQQQALQNNFIGTKTDSTFIGWFAKADYSGNKIAVKDYMVSGNVDLYGKWVLSFGVRITAKDVTLPNDNDKPTGITFANDIFYIADHDDKKIYAYNKDFSRNSSKDTDVKQGGLDYNPFGMKANNGYLYVVDAGGKKVHAYGINDKTYDSSKEINLSESYIPYDILFYNNFLYVTDRGAILERDAVGKVGIYKYTVGGTKLEFVNSNFPTDDGGFEFPIGIIQHKGEISISGLNNDLIISLNLQFQEMGKESSVLQGIDTGASNSLVYICVVDNVYYAVFAVNHKVYAFGTGQ